MDEKKPPQQTSAQKAVADSKAARVKRRAAPALEAKRLAACYACPHLRVARCTLCGCKVTKRARWEDGKCPDKPSRWALTTLVVPPAVTLTTGPVAPAATTLGAVTAPPPSTG